MKKIYNGSKRSKKNTQRIFKKILILLKILS